MPLSVLRGQVAPGSRWTEHDRTLAVALTLHEAGLCQGCGHPVEETTAGSEAWHYEAPIPHRCHACTALAQRQEEYREAETPHALRYRVLRVDDDMEE